GGNAGILTSTISYISDITTEKHRTSRLNIINSLWYLGAPIGTLVGAFIIKYSGYNLALSLVFVAYITVTLYIIIFIKETHGPFAEADMIARGTSAQDVNKDHHHNHKNKNDNNDEKDMLAQDVNKDDHHHHHHNEGKDMLAKDVNVNKDGHLNDNDEKDMLAQDVNKDNHHHHSNSNHNNDDDNNNKKKDVRVRKMLLDLFNWKRVVESFKTAFKKRDGNKRAIIIIIFAANMIRRVARSSLIMVPLLTKKANLTDTTLVMLGTLSIVAEYLSYGLVGGCDTIFFMWLGPVLGVLSNAYIIALRSMSTKLVTKEEKGRISGVSSALNGLMPMAGYALYSPIYYYTVNTFPATQFFIGAGLNLFTMVIFVAMTVLKLTKEGKDEEGGVNGAPKSSTTTTTTTHTPVNNPTTPVNNPTTPVNNPTTPVNNPTTPVNNLTTPVNNPTTPVNNLTTPVNNPTTPVNNPTTPVNNPTTPVNNPTTPVNNPTTPVNNPTTPVNNPTTPVNNPTTPVNNPTTPVNNPTTPVNNPTTPVNNPTTPVNNPTTPVNNPTTRSENDDSSYILPRSLQRSLQRSSQRSLQRSSQRSLQTESGRSSQRSLQRSQKSLQTESGRWNALVRM
ncbi:hypothetical protein Pcinc_036906, partial [Petrolisthes cinctipes]